MLYWLARGWKFHGSKRGGVENVRTHPYRSRDPPSLHSNGYGGPFPGIKPSRRGADHSHLSSANVTERLGLCTSTHPLGFHGRLQGEPYLRVFYFSRVKDALNITSRIPKRRSSYKHAMNSAYSSLTSNTVVYGNNRYLPAYIGTARDRGFSVIGRFRLIQVLANPRDCEFFFFFARDEIPSIQVLFKTGFLWSPTNALCGKHIEFMNVKAGARGRIKCPSVAKNNISLLVVILLFPHRMSSVQAQFLGFWSPWKSSYCLELPLGERLSGTYERCVQSQ